MTAFGKLCACTLVFGVSVSAFAGPAGLNQVSSDAYTQTGFQHATEVEPSSAAWGSTMVSAFQVGRFANGGCVNIGFATTNDGGATWTHGTLPGITKAEGGTFDRVSDASVAFDAAHDVWLVSSLPISDAGPTAVAVNRSTDGGTTWGKPVILAQADLDKNWTTCDNGPKSPFRGHCYTEWDSPGEGNLIYMSTSTDGGQTWSTPATTANKATGVGGQPLVLPNGTVVVPIGDADIANILSFTSTDGGQSWGAATALDTASTHDNSGGLRTEPLPSAAIDGGGTIYLVWQDCRFRKACSANDLVMRTTTDGVNWTPIVRVPIDETTSTADYFIPGIGADPTTSGAGAHLGLTYYYYSKADCTAADCQLQAGFISSSDGGANWTAPQTLTDGASISELPDTSQGRMVGDYIATPFVQSPVDKTYRAMPVIAVPKAAAPGATQFNQGMYAPLGGLEVLEGLTPVSQDPVLFEGWETTQSQAPRTFF
jgi:hypothetical protein